MKNINFLRRYSWKKATIIILLLFVFIPQNYSHSASIQELNQQISEQKRVIEELNNQQKQYQNKIKQKQQESLSLQNEIYILNSEIASTKLGIETTRLQVENINLEMKAINLEIDKKENEIEINKKRVRSALQSLHEEEQKNDTLKILLLNNNLSDFFDEINKLKSIESNLNKKLSNLADLKDWLQNKNENLAKSKSKLETLQKKLEKEEYKLQETQSVKLVFLSNSENNEQKFQKLLAELKAEQQEASNIITQYENQARSLLLGEKGERLKNTGNFTWPVPSKYITSYFHDPDYPFRRIFEHPGIDIRASQGTPLKASSSGYVGVTRDNGYGYSYILLVHGNGLSTVYGHVSKIKVKKGDFVLQGDIIGLSGGMPGTKGAGRLTTGPHLHFEIRSNGVPVNPLIYLSK